MCFGHWISVFEIYLEFDVCDLEFAPFTFTLVNRNVEAFIISGHQQSVVQAPSRGLPHTPSSAGGR